MTHCNSACQVLGVSVRPYLKATCHAFTQAAASGKPTTPSACISSPATPNSMLQAAKSTNLLESQPWSLAAGAYIPCGEQGQQQLWAQPPDLPLTGQAARAAPSRC